MKKSENIRGILSVLPILFSCLNLAGAEPVSVLGYLEPYRSISMNPAEAGVIDVINVREGETVKEGQPLLNLNIRVLEAQLSIAKIQAESTAAIDLADADLGVARERHGKLLELKQSGTAHSSELARAEADLKKAVAQLSMANEEKKMARFKVEEIQGQIEQRILRSPIDGVVLEINREIAESATSPQEGQQNRPLVKLAQIDRLRLVFHAPASQSAALVTGGKLGVRILGQSSLSPDREASGIETEGILEFVSPSIDPATETIRARLVIDNASGRLKSGSHALVLLSKDEAP
jgi:RND family efflux transporter MFP subunit